MPQATIGTAFPLLNDQSTLEPVILYDGPRVSGTNKIITLREDLNNFEYLEFWSAFTSAGSEFSVPPFKIPPSAITTSEFSNTLVASRSSTTALAEVTVISNPTATTSVAVNAVGNSWTNVGVEKVIGYRRRISQTGLDEIMSALAMPNLFINTWHASPSVVNQRNFDGNWSALEIGDYGPDMWLKTSATHKGFIVEAGKYVPNARYLIQADGVVKGEITAPADGNYFSVSFPFASDMFDGRMARVKVPWHPEPSSRSDECKRFFEREEGVVHTLKEYGTGAFEDVSIFFSVEKRVTPTYSATLINSTIQDATISTKSLRIRANGSGTTVYVESWQADATIALNSVPNDAQHRFVFG